MSLVGALSQKKKCDVMKKCDEKCDVTKKCDRWTGGQTLDKKKPVLIRPRPGDLVNWVNIV